jgi:hypothetical protein
MNVSGEEASVSPLLVICKYECMYVMFVRAVVTSMEVQLRYIEPFDIGEWQRMYRPELLDSPSCSPSASPPIESFSQPSAQPMSAPARHHR